jgi:hypothetical protein
VGVPCWRDSKQFVMPAQAGIQEELKSNLDSGIRRSDG